MSRAVRYLDIDLMEKLCHRIAVAVFDTTEDPIAPFHERTLSLLDSALQLPRATFSSKELYPTLEAKAATLFYSLIKNHAFPNGNKRIAVAALLVFLSINDHWINVSPHELYEQAIAIATSERGQRDEVCTHLRAWLMRKIVQG